VELEDGISIASRATRSVCQQILKNLGRTTVKFTAPRATSTAGQVGEGWRSVDHPVLSKAQHVGAFTVEDTGVGMRAEETEADIRGRPAGDAVRHENMAGQAGLAISREWHVLKR